MLISVVSPVYMGASMVKELVARCEQSLSSVTDDYEIILVNDCSPDDSWAEIQRICQTHPKVVGVDLSRNFGQHPAISAGLSLVKGEWIVVMDCDLQDRPEEIPALYNKVQEGWDMILARRIKRQDKYLKKLSGRVFYKVYDWMSGQKSDPTIANFGIYHKKIIKEIVKIPDLSRSFEPLLAHLGFRKGYLDVTHGARAQGSSSYSLKKLLHFALENCIANSNKPLRVAVSLGFIMSIASILLAFYNIFAKIFGLIDVEGFTTTVFSIWFVGGVILLVLGVLGLYQGRIYDQVKGRPYVVIREIINKSA